MNNKIVNNRILWISTLSVTIVALLSGLAFFSNLYTGSSSVAGHRSDSYLEKDGSERAEPLAFKDTVSYIDRGQSISNAQKEGAAPLEWASSAEMLDAYAERDRVFLHNFNRLYGGILDFDVPEQWAWKVAHGYPTPDQVLQAEAMTNEELSIAAHQGDNVAAMLLYGRMLDMLRDVREQAALNGENAGDWYHYIGDEQRSLLSMTRGLKERLLESNTPYAGYLVFRESAMNKDRYGAVAGLWYAYRNGDPLGLFALENDKHLQEELGLNVDINTVLSILWSTNRVNPGQAQAFKRVDMIPVSPLRESGQ